MSYENVITVKLDLVLGIIIDDISDHLPIFGLYRLGDTKEHNDFYRRK